MTHSDALSNEFQNGGVKGGQRRCRRARGNTRETASQCVTASLLETLIKRVARLSPDWVDQQRFYEERSEIAAGLRAVGREIGR